MPVENVIVLGGGSAGFLAALTLKTKLSALSVRLLRSAEIGIIGVGEGSTATLTHFLHQYLKISPARFHALAQPTWKLGLKFLWGPRPSFNYTFGPGLDFRLDTSLPKANGFYCEENIEYPDPFSALMTNDRAFPQKDGLPLFHENFAYHFENEKFVSFLEESARAAGVEVIDTTVTDVRQDERGIAGLTLESGDIATADLFVDCSGFASVLLGKTLREPFISFAPSLFCERAVVGGWDRKGAEDHVIKPYTTCETMSAGWAWQIEHEHRINRGYVYSPAFISDEDAEREFRAANPKVGSTRVVRFTSGRRERAWVGNVVAIGNAAGFVEPLEATALGVIAQQCRVLAESLLAADREPRPTQRAMFNRFNARFWDAIRGFLAIHYKFNTRLDTPFWHHCRADTDLAGAAGIADYYAENGPDGFWGPTLLENPHDQFGIGGYITLLTGMKVPHRQTYRPTEREMAIFDARRKQHREVALRSLSVRDALAVIRSPRWRWPA